MRRERGGDRLNKGGLLFSSVLQLQREKETEGETQRESELCTCLSTVVGRCRSSRINREGNRQMRVAQCEEGEFEHIHCTR